MALINVDEKKKREEFPEVDVNTVNRQETKIDTSKKSNVLTWLLEHKIVMVCGILVIVLIIGTLIGVKYITSHIVPDDHEHIYVDHLCKYCNKEETYEISYVDESGEHTIAYSYFMENITQPKLTQKLGYTAKWSEEVNENGKKIVTAVYTIINFNINYHIQIEGIENNPDNPATYTINDKVELKKIELDGYYFTNWYTDPDYQNSITEIPVGSTGDLELYGKINANQTLITFNLNGGSGNVPNVGVPALGSYVFEEVDVTKRAYKFLGWSLTKDGAVKYKVGDTFNAQAINAKMTVFAVWEKNKTVITYNANGGDGEDAIQEFECFVPTKLNKSQFVRNAATLIGWSYEPDGSLDFKVDDSFTANEEEKQITLYAKWKTNTNVLVFDPNGGIGQMNNVSVESLTSVALPQSVFTFEGSKFIGWSTTKNGEVQYIDQAIYLANADDAEITLYAIWAINNEITIHFHNNGGVGYAPDMKVELLNSVNLPTTGFTKPGLTFAGWALSSLGEIAYVENYTYNTRILGSEITLYAVYDENRTIIRYKPNGGTGTMENQEIAAGKNANLTPNAYTNPGYKFLGWSYTKDGSVDVYDKAYFEAEHRLVTIELYAVWQRNVTTIIFMKNGSSGAMLNQEVESNSSVFLQECKFTKTTSYFAGWALEPTGEIVYTNKQVFTAESDNETVYLYAIFKTNRTLFVYDANGGVGDPYTSEIPFSTKGNVAECTFTKANYSFYGWCVDTEYQGQELYLANQEYTAGADFKEIHLYAIWKRNKTTINFSSNYSTEQMEPIEVQAGDKCTLPLNQFTRLGYSFIGWSINNYGVSSYSDGDEFIGLSDNATVTLTPVWQINKVILTFNPNGGSGYMAPYNLNAFEKTFLPKCVFEKENMHFIGWGVGSKAEANYVENEEYIAPTESGEIIVYAIWEDNIQELTLVFNDGTGTEETIDFDVINGDSITIIPEKENYEFLGWKLYEDMDSVDYLPGAFVVLGVAEEYVLYGVFKEYVGTLGLIYEPIYDENIIVSYVVADYEGDSADVIIPGIYNTRPITGIKDNAFKDNDTVETVKLVNNITFIGNHAFDGCENLKTIDLGKKIVSIGEYAFAGTDLETLVIPNTVTTIGKYALYNNYQLSNVTLSTALTEIPEGMFSECGVLNLNIHSNIKKIGYKAFYNAYAIETITFEEGIETIEDYAFYFCVSLKTLTFPNSLKTIGKNAFETCVLIESVTFGNNLERIESKAFASTVGLETITIPSSCNFIGEAAFKDSSLTEVSILGPIKYVNKSAFANNYDLKTVILPNTVEIIFDYAFENCSQLTSIVIPSSISVIKSNAFLNSSLNTIYYEGLTANWDLVTKQTNAYPSNVNVYIYSEQEPLENVENYWHYVNGNPRRWIAQ